MVSRGAKNHCHSLLKFVQYVQTSDTSDVRTGAEQLHPMTCTDLQASTQLTSADVHAP
jgi:hypothetical protein